MSAASAKRDFLVSIRPDYADKIMQGMKTVELRRRFSDVVEKDAIALIYSTSPTKAIIGSAHISSVRRLPLDKLWNDFGQSACIAKDDFYEYFSGLAVGYAILLDEVKPLRRPVSASELKKELGFIAPQSFRYLPKEYYYILNDENMK